MTNSDAKDEREFRQLLKKLFYFKRLQLPFLITADTSTTICTYKYQTLLIAGHVQYSLVSISNGTDRNSKYCPVPTVFAFKATKSA